MIFILKNPVIATGNICWRINDWRLTGELESALLHEKSESEDWEVLCASVTMAREKADPSLPCISEGLGLDLRQVQAQN